MQLRTGATGTGRLARFFLHVEHVLLGLAITSTLTWMFARQCEEEAWFLALDAFWPLSMLGMFVIGIRIAIAGRWTGAARWWPLGAESWAPVNIPVAQLAAGAASFTGGGAPGGRLRGARRRPRAAAGADRSPRLTRPPHGAPPPAREAGRRRARGRLGG